MTVRQRDLERLAAFSGVSIDLRIESIYWQGDTGALVLFVYGAIAAYDASFLKIGLRSRLFLVIMSRSPKRIKPKNNEESFRLRRVA
jgi:hypothetical protein